MKKKLKKILWITSVCICSFVIAICGYKIYSQLNEYNVGVKTYKSLEQYVKFQDNQDETKSETKSESKNEHSKDVKFPKVDFKSLSKVNSDIVGWIYGEEGTINYPIAQTDNNNYYLEHLFDKTVNSSGCLFL
jgi:sortase B